MEQGTLTLKNGTSVPFTVVRSSQRKRSYALTVSKEGAVEFRAPRWVPLAELLKFGQARSRFIGNRLNELASREAKRHEKAAAMGEHCPLPPEWYRNAGRIIFPARLQHWAKIIGVTYTGPRITSGKHVWGSCCSTGAISLSYRLLMVPEDLREYVIVHELCHRKYMSHGPRFWATVGKYVPDYVAKRRALNTLGAEIG